MFRRGGSFRQMKEGCGRCERDGIMDTFYAELEKALETSEGDVWAETVLTGEHAGEKRLLAQSEICGTKSGVCSRERVFRERIGRAPKLIICGAGHVSIPMILMGRMLGFTVTVIEDRPKFADNARAAGADRVICEPFASGLAKITGDLDSWFIIVTRGHRYDRECLESILGKKYAYVGMMGSRRRVAIVKEQLEEAGISRGALEGVHTPIGLKIGAETPEEIAVSVMAEIIEVKSKRNREDGAAAGGYSKEMLAAILENEPKSGPRKKVLATIVSRKGSAPRSAGTKMLIFEDGSTVDTIGGGCAESEIMQKARLMMQAGEPAFEICRVDMTAAAAEDEGMVCGGALEVMLEQIG